MALPLLEAMTPLQSAHAVGAMGSEGQPVRFASFFFPNGVDHSRFTPKGRGLSDLPPILEPLSELRDYVNVITGLNLPDGGHAAGTSAFLTGQKPKKTAKANEVNVGNGSLDQLIGNAVRSTTVLPGLELATHTPKSGVSMSGHSKIYLSFSAWRNATTPVPPEINPKRAFDRLFKDARVTMGGGGGGGRRKAAPIPKPDKSVLDIVLDDAKDLKNRLGRADQQKLDEYLTAVREVEDRVTNQVVAHKQLRITSQVMQQITATGKQLEKLGKGNGLSSKPNIPYPEHIRLHLDVMALAFWSNTTRSANFMFGDGLNGTNMSFLDGVQGNHHSASHHGYKKDALQMFSLINRYFVGEYAYFLEKLKSMPEGGSNVLENSVVLMGTNLSSGQSHAGKNVPVLLSGHAGGSLRGNRHIEAKGEPIANLHRSILDKMDVDAKVKGGADKLRGV